MNRYDLQDLALIRCREAYVLLENGNYEGSYYLCGYAVECGLKACIAKQTRLHDFPDKKVVNASYSHKLEDLVKIAALEPNMDNELKSNPDFADNWYTVKDWSEKSRYEKHTDKEARDLYSAVADEKQGVLQWIKRHW
ncbi:MAG: DNA-binding protein [Candidatus Methanogaster sp.]|uniref:DNA-binding protein n=1 Tax=Candidatus Methanogaster sp. TaxID=3386292 RepID=A0AC61L2L8_9EURY|nr:MAG: DNA-binding protein [ANME-2 cluster archaeon]